MLWSRRRKLVVLFPLLLVWILYQLKYYNQRLAESHKTSNRKLSSTDDILVNLSLKYQEWSPPNIVNKNYDYPNFMEDEEKNMANKLWFMKDGILQPEQLNIDVEHALFPEQWSGDRILEQLMYVPKNYSRDVIVYSSSINKVDTFTSHKKILLVGKFERIYLHSGLSIFLKDKCPVNTCTLAGNADEARNADAVIFNGNYIQGIDLFVRRQPHHVWILYLQESPVNSVELGNPNNHLINWTASYRYDSDIVTSYWKFVPYRNMSSYFSRGIKINNVENINYAANKSKKVAWFVSNCDAKNDRLQYAESLSQYIEVDIFGKCGAQKCPKFMHGTCLKMLDRHYKFYLSFENCNCKEYITEKFFQNGLGYGVGHNILPIVMGPEREDYLRVAPPNSFIHVNDFASPEELADYLHVLDANDTLYNQYFKWKTTGELIDTRFWCRLCAMLHAPHRPKSYGDIEDWWSGPGVCEP